MGEALCAGQKQSCVVWLGDRIEVQVSLEEILIVSENRAKEKGTLARGLARGVAPASEPNLAA